MLIRTISAAILAAIPAFAGRYCDSELNICFQEQRTEADIHFRVAVPVNASGSFPIVLQIVAPITTRWAGFAWGGGMVNNPLTVAWPFGPSVVVSSRYAGSHSTPGLYPEAQLTPIGSTGANETHWQASVLCEGCSSWFINGARGQLSTQSQSAVFAWARSEEAPAGGWDADEARLGYHDRRGRVQINLRDAQSETFDEVYEHIGCGERKRKRHEGRRRGLRRRGIERIYV